MNHGSLFAGIGGNELAASWMGWENVFSVEFDSFCQKVLKHHFPTTHHYGDIREFDGTPYRGTIDVLTGGFPCQPFSAAGKRRGTEDNRFLWPEMLRVIREVQPTWIVAENVRGIVSIDNGLVFERVCAELEANEYEVQPICIPACAIGAPHKRERIWFVAHRNDHGNMRISGINQSESGERTGEGIELRTEYDDEARNSVAAPDTTGEGLARAGLESKQQETNEKYRTEHSDCLTPDTEGRELGGIRHASETEGTRTGDELFGEQFRICRQTEWQDWLSAATRLCTLDDGLPRGLDGITVSRWRNKSLSAAGNAIVPQVLYQIFQAISRSV